uniref:Putative DNA recombination protein n=1 Tax=viral metagenome TaxID=1070528 RepID=A0A6M3KKN9_9ZZZZ
MITEDELSLEDMKQAEANGYLCAKCQHPLTVAWGGGHGIIGWILRCQDITHTGMTRHDIKYEKQKKEFFSMESTALTKMDEKQMIERVNMARFPQDLTVPEKKLLAQVAITYGFDPLMGEVTIYQGRPFVSIDGRYRKAQETGLLDGVETRPATKEERTDWQIPDGDFFYRSEVYVKGSSRPFVAWGRVYHAETTGGKGFKPVEKNPQRMAEKRAEAQALRKAFHIPLPSFEDIGSPEYDIETTARVVDVTTGEVTEKPKAKPAKEIDKRGEFEKEGHDVLKETVAKTVQKPAKEAKKPDPEELFPETEPTPEPKPEPEEPEPETSPIDLQWLKDQMETLEGKGITAYSVKNVLSYLNVKTGHQDKKVSDAVRRLTKEQAEAFAKQVQDAVDMS